MVKDKEKIFIRGVNWVGDAVMTIPAIRSLRIALRDAEISQLLRPTVASIFDKHPDINNLLIYEESYKGITGKINLINMLKSKSFSKAFLFQNAFDAAMLAFLAGIPERIGYNRDGRGFMLTNPVEFNGEDRKIHHIEYYLTLLRRAGIKAEYSIPYIFQSHEERSEARERLSKLKRPIIGINPGATYGSAKRWIPQRFAEIIIKVISNLDGSVVIFGGKNEEATAMEIERFTANMSEKLSEDEQHSRLLNLAGKTTLRELINLISECDALITNDSGPMHISYAVGTPLVAIFGSTSPALTGPPEEGNVVIRSNIECSPCFKRICPLNNIKCMEGITVDEVYHGLEKVIPRKKVVFFDRDGTLCKEVDYLSRWEDFTVFPEIESLTKLIEKGYYLIGVSNQSGIGRGYVDEKFVQEVNSLFIDSYLMDDFFYCPHHPADNCSCRKPQLSLLYKARAKYNIDFKSSYVVGDKDTDMLLAKAAGAKGILVKTGKQIESPYSTYTANNLADAVDYILRTDCK